ncbi:MAG: PAS domain S-box protein [Bacteroidetes bacterium]|nr:PAS domain S-box protein [Bacteroidota bacterium]
MKNFLLFKWLTNISIKKKLYFTMGIMALLIALELFTLWFAIHTLSSVRAYVGGEGLWSKAQKDAIYHLEKYGYTRNATYFGEYENFMRVPIGDHKARIELEKKYPDYGEVREGLREGRNNEHDIDGMINLFRRFHNISYINKAISIWAVADSISSQLIPIASKLHAEINSPNPSQSAIDSTLLAIGPINTQLTKLEDDFSYTLGEGSRWLENLILKILFSIALTVEITGLLLTVSVSKGIQKGLKEILNASEKIAKGDFSARAKKYSRDEIGVLADSFNRMTEELNYTTVEKKRSKTLLKESEEIFRLFSGSISDYAIFMIDHSGYVKSWNEGTKRICGYTEEEIVGKHISVFYTPEMVAAGEPKKNLDSAYENGNFTCEGWRLRKDGSLFWADIIYTSLFDDNGNLKGYAKIVRDNTNRKITENKLVQSMAQLASAQQLAHIGSWEWTFADNAIDWSEEMYRIYGLEQKNGEISYEKIFSMMHPEDKQRISRIIVEARKNHKPFSFQHRIIRPDNSLRTLSAKGEVIVNESGEAIKVVGTDQDITERFQEEEMEKLVMAATKSNNSVLITDSNGNIEWVNEGFTKLTGYTLEEIRNTHGELLRKGSDTGLTGNSEFFENLITNKKPVVYESKNYTKTGNEYWVITTLTPVIGKDGKLERIIAIDSDITERKRIEEDLILANRIAEHSLKKGNKALNELIKAKKDLEESMQVKEQFLAKMSHEIRTPMNAIVGLTDILLDGNVSEDQKECLEAIQLSSDNLLSIINDILDFSKLKSGTVSVELIPFKMQEVIDGVLLTLRISASRKGIALSYSPGKDRIPEFVKGDPLRLRQILLNLVSNSVKFTESGRVDISIGITAEDAENYKLTFIVKDTGIGIPQDRLATIFESFTQASNETSRKYGGTGLGLTIVKQLTELLDGTIEVESRIGYGSTFRITLPFRKCESDLVPAQIETHSGVKEKFENLNVILAEDNEMNQMLASKVFEQWGLHLDIACNGKEVIEKMNAKDYDIVLMDIQMPEMDGYEATQFIRGKMPLPKSEVPIIAMTAHALVGEAEKCLALGMDDYISKPFSRKTLHEKISALLRKKKANCHCEPEKPNIENPLSTSETNIDLTYLEQIAEGNHEFVKKMLETFLKQTPVMLEDMWKYVNEKKWKELSGVAHKMKPSLDFIGIHSLKTTVADLEKKAGLGETTEEFPDMVKKVTTVCNGVIVELNKKISTMV